MTKGRRCIAIMISAVLAGTLFTGCNVEKQLLDMTEDYIDVTATISDKSKWVDSDILGAVTEDTNVSEKDDFSTAVNKDWILSMQDKAKKEGNVTRLENNDDVISEQKQKLLKTAASGGDFAENKIGMDKKDYEHISEIFTDFVELAGDWEERNAEGINPLESYVKEIESIDSLEKMSAYLCGEYGSFFSQAYLVPFSVSAPLDESDEYTVILTSFFDDSRKLNSDVSDKVEKVYVMETVTGILKEMGYSTGDAEKIVKRCWQMETDLSEHSAAEKQQEGDSDTVKKLFNNKYTRDELKDMAGDYPLLDTLKVYNYDTSKEYTVCEPMYVEGVAELYKEKNLEKLKSYYIVHTVLNAMPLLSREYYDQYAEYLSAETDENSNEEQDEDQEESLDNLSETDRILQTTVITYMQEIFEEMYAANYCSTEQKVYLQNIIKDAIQVYERMLRNEDWMSEKTQQKAIEKLNNIAICVLYPDELNGYQDLSLEGDNLLEAAAKLNNYSKKREARKINTKVNKTTWNLQETPTTTINAYYNQNNSIMILAGVIADQNTFDVNASYEENLGHIGFIIGHEISHAFDTKGYQYDKDGNYKKWWTKQDEQKFQTRVGKLAEYFSKFSYLAGTATTIDGDRIKGEAIADMGGVKCMLTIAKEHPDFDYQKFFRAYAQTLVALRSLSMEMRMGEQDEHPLSFLRTNVTIQQFDEFYEAFDIQPGDGMYLTPEKRIAVW